MAETTELTVDQAASQMEGLLSAEDGTQEPEKEGADKAEAGPGDEAEGEPAEEPEESEEAESGEDPEAEPSYTVKIDGKDAKVALSELVKGYQRTADYTRKTQDIAKQREAVSDLASSIKAEREHYAGQLEKVKAVLEAAQPKEPDWDNLIAQDPIQAYRLKLQFDRHQDQLRAVEAEQAKVRAAQEADEAKSNAEYLAEQQSRLIEAIPEWKDAKKASAEKAKLVEHGVSYGYTPEELAQVTDARAVQVLRDAMLYRQMQAKLAGVKPNVQQPTVRSARGGTSQQTPANNLARDMKRLKQTGDTADAAAAFMHFID